MDRRQAQRILVDLEVDYQCEDTYLFAYITDMSALGIFIRTNNPERAGTHLNMRFKPPGEQDPLELEGEVIWINPFRPGSFENTHPGMGVQFVDLAPEARRKLLALVRKIAYLERSEEDEDEDLEQDDTGEETSQQADAEDDLDDTVGEMPGSRGRDEASLALSMNPARGGDPRN